MNSQRSEVSGHPPSPGYGGPRKSDAGSRRSDFSYQLSTINHQPLVELHIERLVLDGLPLGSVESARFQNALKRELGRLLNGAEAINWNSAALTSVSTSPVRLIPGDSPATWGRQTAAALFRSLPADGITEAAVRPDTEPSVLSRTNRSINK